ncbi:MAG: EamA family transporter, partial [Thermoplasmata archaeon]|nr:EamA family transporter [Thermoplasmata archaeon]
MGIVIISALIVAVESVAVEGALNIAIIDVFIVASIPSIIGGLILIALQPRPSIKFVRDLGKKDWKFLIVLSVVASVGVFMWYDAVGRIGAGKEAILGGGSSEVLFVLLLSAIFLSERLKRLEIVGSIMVLVGVFLVLV